MVTGGSEVIVLQKPVQPRRAIRGLSRSKYPPTHLEKERQSWDLGRLREFLIRQKRIALDTSIFYQLEANSHYVDLTDQAFQWLSWPNPLAVTSTITMTELLVHPYREAHERQAALIYALLSTYPNLL